eukprot:3672386-Amphidinium_carterae.1
MPFSILISHQSGLSAHRYSESIHCDACGCTQYYHQWCMITGSLPSGMEGTAQERHRKQLTQMQSLQGATYKLRNSSSAHEEKAWSMRSLALRPNTQLVNAGTHFCMQM